MVNMIFQNMKMRYLKDKILNFFLLFGFHFKRIKFDSKIVFVNNNQNSSKVKINLDEIFFFLDRVDLFYKKLNLRKELKIGGAWLKDLKKRRLTQNTIYKKKSQKIILDFHEKMFFNELVKGLWNYSYVNDLDKLVINRFIEDYNKFIKIHNYPKILFSEIPFQRWGVKLNSKILSFNDIWHTEQAIVIKNLTSILNVKKLNDTFHFLEIGSGYGGLIEKLNKFNIFNKYILIDIPHNLITTYYFLSKVYGQNKVCLVRDVQKLNKLLNTKDIKFILIPSCFYDVVKNLKGYFFFHNSGSFSEMDRATINYYIKNLPKKTMGISNINSNTDSLNTGFHREIPIDKINMDNKFKILFEGTMVSSSTDRYKLKCYYNLNLIKQYFK